MTKKLYIAKEALIGYYDFLVKLDSDADTKIQAVMDAMTYLHDYVHYAKGFGWYYTCFDINIYLGKSYDDIPPSNYTSLFYQMLHQTEKGE